MAPLTADAKRLRMMIVTFPVFVVTSAILYRRTYWGEEQRRISPKPDSPAADNTILQHGKALGGAPWTVQGEAAEREGRR